MVANVSPSCMKMELISAISSGLLPSAMQHAKVDTERASSQDCLIFASHNGMRGKGDVEYIPVFHRMELAVIPSLLNGSISSAARTVF